MHKKIFATILLLSTTPTFADVPIITAYDNSYYAEVDDPTKVKAGTLVGISDTYYYYDPTNKKLTVTHTEWLADGTGTLPGMYEAPYNSTMHYTDVTFDNMCSVIGYCDEITKSKIEEMRTECESYLTNSTQPQKTNNYTPNPTDNYTNKNVSTLKKELSAGIASASAMSAIEASNVGKGEVSVGSGYGYYNSQSAIAFGTAIGLADNWSINAAVGLTESDVAYRAGTNYKFKLFK